MREDFLHFLWRTRRFDTRNLATTDGVPVSILHPGEWNPHAGPDFCNARIRLGDTLWAGNVEMHLRASEWRQHGHDRDPAYDNVVLHVVLDEDQPIHRPGGERLPCLVMRQRIPPRVLQAYHLLGQMPNWVPCQSQINRVPSLVVSNWLDRMLVERLEMRATGLENALEQCGADWEEAFFRTLSHHFGQTVNAQPFDMLARLAPLRLLARHRNSGFQLEALLFGQAGMLDQPFSDLYAGELQREYRFLQRKYALSPMPGSVWKFLRLRPANFPTLRIAQLAGLLCDLHMPWSKVLESTGRHDLESLLLKAPSDYWKERYQFDKPAPCRIRVPGKDFVHHLIVNAVAPFMFVYGKKYHLPAYRERALNLFQDLPPEDNAVIRQWKHLGIKPANAGQAQGLLELKTRYCSAGRCLECHMGQHLLQ